MCRASGNARWLSMARAGPEHAASKPCPGAAGEKAREVSARAPPKGCSLPRIFLPLRIGSSPQQVAGIPPSGRGGGGGLALGDAEASGSLIETPAPEAPCDPSHGVGPIQAIVPHLEKSDYTLASLFTGLGS